MTSQAASRKSRAKLSDRKLCDMAREQGAIGAKVILPDTAETAEWVCWK